MTLEKGIGGVNKQQIGVEQPIDNNQDTTNFSNEHATLTAAEIEQQTAQVTEDLTAILAIMHRNNSDKKQAG